MRQLKLHILLGFSLLSQPICFADGLHELTGSQQADVLGGRQVSIFDAIPDSQWPRCRVYQRVDTTPEEAAAVFHDYARQSEYVHRVKESSILRQYNRRTTALRFGLGLPVPLQTLFGTPSYDVIATLNSNSASGSYSIRWVKLQAQYIQTVEGEIRFEPLGSSTLVSYWNTLIPSIHIPSLFQGIVEAAIKRGSGEAMDSIVQRIHLLRSNHYDLMSAEVQSLRHALQ